MDRRNLPLNALRAFEVTARLGSLSKAADELLVTHSAISQQIRTLETLVEKRLFDRTNRGVVLTDAGHDLVSVLTKSFNAMERVIDGLAKDPDDQTLVITATPSFTAKWLTPRLKSWPIRQSALDIQFKPTLTFLDLNAGEADIAIRCGEPPWEGLIAERFLAISMTPVCSPEHPLLENPAPTPEDLTNYNLLHADVSGHGIGEEWRIWFESAGISIEQQDILGPSFADPSLSMQAAMGGVGIALGYLELVEQDLAAGRLVQPIKVTATHHFSYYLVYSERSQQLRKVQLFRDWVYGELPAGEFDGSAV